MVFYHEVFSKVMAGQDVEKKASGNPETRLLTQLLCELGSALVSTFYKVFY